ncbi:DUF6932 family protein [Demequina silvatica]|uniref:DUF6932 family protein n=1 Tax=Demequina silvatica TaxID=1638988 RepID=UPI0007801BDA|nr:hypothetical protein [Demequina silvatica]
MALGTPRGDYGTLEPRIHRATLDEVEQLFVRDAPFAAEREHLFNALRGWVANFDAALPGARLWLDGGFVTHKPWAPPKDVDIVAHHTQDVAEAWSEAEHKVLASLLNGADGTKPMGGLVDAYWFISGDPHASPYWKNQWSRVRGEDGREVIGHAKGFVEVVRA